MTAQTAKISSLNNFPRLKASKYSQKSYYARAISSNFASINLNLYKFRIIYNIKANPQNNKEKEKEKIEIRE
ncbi:hypothetical protein IMY05_013G0072100 [Salix suchowensis]|nr:hypothetical protein IMY05_013G0072100 [Salix suchowensis]